MDSYVGKRLDGRYEIREIIGVGGMAVVYKAYDNIDDRIVAVKILKEEFLANEEFRRRFKNESKAIAVLSHPNIVKVYDVSFGDKLQYIVMEYIEGITLKEYIEQQKVINWKEAVHFTTQILRALQHAHDKGIVHRDVKPQNIMLLQNGNIKVTDFGIARFSRSETRTMTESAIGSVHYISPEQARGEITDDKADIYSVGVVLYEMITGQLPFQSDSAVSVAIMQLQADAKPPREINDSIPLGLEQITLRAMQKNTKDRYQSAAEMLLDLDEFKRNPAIKFDYNYFVDDEPTKYINKPMQPQTGALADIAAGGSDMVVSDYEDEEAERKSTLPVLVGVLSALVVVIILIISFLYFFTDVFKKDKVTVPDFLGLNYAEEIKDNKDYSDFKFKVTYVTSSTSKYDEGEVVKQNPSSGSKLAKGGTVELEVLSSGTTETVPKIIGQEVGTAKQMLAAAGFSNVTVETQYDADSEPGIVLSCDPDEGAKVDTSSEITLYVSTDQDPNAVPVPGITGLSVSDAQKALENSKLKLGDKKYEDSTEPKDTVIRQSVSEGEKVTKGSNIDVVLSSGVAPSSTVSVSFKLPNIGNGTVVAYLNNEAQLTKSLRLDGSNYSFSITGSGSGTILVTVDGTDYFKCTVDFTAKTVSGPTYLSGVLPDVTGNTESVAKSDLSKFINVSIQYKPVSVFESSKIGYVLSQSPEGGDSATLTKFSTPITLIVGSK